MGDWNTTHKLDVSHVQMIFELNKGLGNSFRGLVLKNRKSRCNASLSERTGGFQVLLIVRGLLQLESTRVNSKYNL